MIKSETLFGSTSWKICRVVPHHFYAFCNICILHLWNATVFCLSAAKHTTRWSDRECNNCKNMVSYITGMKLLLTLFLSVCHYDHTLSLNKNKASLFLLNYIQSVFNAIEWCETALLSVACSVLSFCNDTNGLSWTNMCGEQILLPQAFLETVSGEASYFRPMRPQKWCLPTGPHLSVSKSIAPFFIGFFFQSWGVIYNGSHKWVFKHQDKKCLSFWWLCKV